MEGSRGFTIVELLIVIVVIAILAAITIVGYRGIQENAKTAVITDAVQSWETAIQRAVIEGGTLPAAGVCLGSVGDFPAVSGFGQNVCVVVNGNPGVVYDDTYFSGWPATATRPKGQLPQTKYTGSGAVFLARGIWVHSSDTSFRSITIAWVPQVSEKCGSGSSVAPGDSALSGGYCLKSITY